MFKPLFNKPCPECEARKQSNTDEKAQPKVMQGVGYEQISLEQVAKLEHREQIAYASNKETHTVLRDTLSTLDDSRERVARLLTETGRKL